MRKGLRASESSLYVHSLTSRVVEPLGQAAVAPHVSGGSAPSSSTPSIDPGVQMIETLLKVGSRHSTYLQLSGLICLS